MTLQELLSKNNNNKRITLWSIDKNYTNVMNKVRLITCYDHAVLNDYRNYVVMSYAIVGKQFVITVFNK